LSTLAAPIAPAAAFSVRNFNRLAELIHSYSGIKMPPGKRTMLAGRLNRRMRAVGVTTPDDYCHHLFEEGGLEAEMVYLIDAVTTNKTDFFREPMHFDFMTTEGLPALADAGRRDIRVWSAAASNGAEAYTLAMVLEEFCAARRLNYSILATDICTEVLDQALAGRFPKTMVDPVPMDLRHRYVLQAKDSRNAEIRIAPHLRSKVSFGRLNLMDERYPVGREMDFVFCRNILIYFDKPTQAKVLSRLCAHLRPGGYLVLGHSESLVGVDLPVTPVGNTIFQRA
jgi:chemotaxis protein methyltransferase CheR